MSIRKNLRKELADKTAKEYFLEQSAADFDELVVVADPFIRRRRVRAGYYQCAIC